MTRILLVDDHPLVRDGLRARLEAKGLAFRMKAQTSEIVGPDRVTAAPRTATWC